MKFEPLLDGPGGTQFAVAPDSIAMTEEVYVLTGTTPNLDPDMGTIQPWTLTGNSTPVDTLTDGQSMTLKIADGDAYSITWPTMVWIGGSAPPLATTGWTWIALIKEGTTLYGAHLGDSA